MDESTAIDRFGDENVRPELSRLERFLRLFANVGTGEGLTSLILAANLFLILMAYYFIKPVREGWLSVSLLKGLSSLEVKAYSAFGQSLLLLGVVPVYAALAAIWTRHLDFGAFYRSLTVSLVVAGVAA